MNKIIFLFSFLLIPLVTSKVFPPQSLTDLNIYASCSTNYNFGYLLLAIQWEPSFCYNKVCAPHDNSWGIHGLWPQYLNGSWPQYCCFEKDFDASKLDSIRTELLIKWKTLNQNGNSESFWKHEWQKHGTCGMISDQIKGQFNYFDRTLRLFDSLPLKNWLTDGNIVASSHRAYTLNEIHESIEKALQYKVELECTTQKPYPLLAHIYVCLDKDTLKPIHCPRNDDPQCGNGFVLIPEAKA